MAVLVCWWAVRKRIACISKWKVLVREVCQLYGALILVSTLDHILLGRSELRFDRYQLPHAFAVTRVSPAHVPPAYLPTSFLRHLPATFSSSSHIPTPFHRPTFFQLYNYRLPSNFQAATLSRKASATRWTRCSTK